MNSVRKRLKRKARLMRLKDLIQDMQDGDKVSRKHDGKTALSIVDELLSSNDQAAKREVYHA